jgi:hypothetical protein
VERDTPGGDPPLKARSVHGAPAAHEGAASSRFTAEAQTLRDSEAEYELEYPAVCSACGRTIVTIKVVRLMRTWVNFTSTLPRRGSVVICPHCRTIVSAALTLV